jgi:putative endonuclease
MHYVYVLCNTDDCSDRYVGYTKDLKIRMLQHNSSNSKKYTSNRKWKLAYYEAFQSKEDAQKREKRLKDDGRAKRQLFERIKHCF